MKKDMKIKFLILIPVIILILASSYTAYAAGPLYKITRPSKMTNKLMFGVINIPLCLMEVPKSINTNVKNTDYFTGTFVGLGEGAFKTSKRFGYGLFQIVTFPFPEVKTLDNWVDDPLPFKELSE
jgi:putative exosortase-associated protein (TIGR04073 family)